MALTGEEEDGDGGGIFPLVDRRTPVLDRMREVTKTDGERFGETLAGMAREQPDQQYIDNFFTDLEETLCRELMCDPEDLDEQFINDFVEMAMSIRTEDLVKDETEQTETEEAEQTSEETSEEEEVEEDEEDTESDTEGPSFG